MIIVFNAAPSDAGKIASVAVHLGGGDAPPAAPGKAPAQQNPLGCVQIVTFTVAGSGTLCCHFSFFSDSDCRSETDALQPLVIPNDQELCADGQASASPQPSPPASSGCKQTIQQYTQCGGKSACPDCANNSCTEEEFNACGGLPN